MGTARKSHGLLALPNTDNRPGQVSPRFGQRLTTARLLDTVIGGRHLHTGNPGEGVLERRIVEVYRAGCEVAARAAR